jgi:hypothetical protein
VTMQRFAVELKRRTVGIAVRLGGGFVFYSSDRDFEEMDGRTFRRARAIERELKKIANRRKREKGGFRTGPAFALT